MHPHAHPQYHHRWPPSLPFTVPQRKLHFDAVVATRLSGTSVKTFAFWILLRGIRGTACFLFHIFSGTLLFRFFLPSEVDLSSFVILAHVWESLYVRIRDVFWFRPLMMIWSFLIPQLTSCLRDSARNSDSQKLSFLCSYQQVLFSS